MINFFLLYPSGKVKAIPQIEKYLLQSFFECIKHFISGGYLTEKTFS